MVRRSAGMTYEGTKLQKGSDWRLGCRILSPLLKIVAAAVLQKNEHSQMYPHFIVDNSLFYLVNRSVF